MKPDDETLDYPCPRCTAATGMPCVQNTGQRLIERALPHSERAALVPDRQVEFANRVRAAYGAELYDQDDARWLSRDEAAHHGPPFGDA